MGQSTLGMRAPVPGRAHRRLVKGLGTPGTRASAARHAFASQGLPHSTDWNVMGLPLQVAVH